MTEPRYENRADGAAERDRDHVDDPGRVDRGDGRGRVDAAGRGGVEARRGNWAATAALVCGVAGLITLFLFPPLGLLLALVAVVLGIMGLAKARDPYVGGMGQAIAGLVTGAIVLVLTALLIWGITALFENSDFQEQLQNQINQLQEESGG